MRKEKSMKNFLLLLVIAIITVQSVHAVTVSKYFDHGLIYSGSSFPVDVAKNADVEMPSLEGLKTGESAVNNILGLVEAGDGSIEAAARNGGIKKITHVDITEKSVFIFWRGVTVTVYGE